MKNRYWTPFIFILYVLSAKLGLLLAVINPSTTAVWPPTGIAIAAMLVLGKQVWPAVFLGAFLTNLSTSGSLLSSLGIAIGNTLEGLLAVFLINRYSQGIKTFEIPENVIRFTVLAGFIAPIVSATIGCFALAISGLADWSSYWSIWLTWWLGDMGGAIVIGSFIIIWSQNFTNPLRHSFIELFIVTIALIGSCYVIFTGIAPFPYLVFPFLLWISYRFTIRETISEIVLLSALSLWATLHNFGPFISQAHSYNQALLYLQLYMVIITVTKLTVSSVVMVNRRIQSDLVDHEHWFRTLIEKGSDAITIINQQGIILFSSPNTKAILGYTPEEIVGKNGLTLVHPDDLKPVTRLLNAVSKRANSLISTELRVKRKNGNWIWLEAVVRNLIHDPVVSGLVVNYRDISERKDLELAKNEFLMTAAHQLGSPLGILRWNLELLLNSASTAKNGKTKLSAMHKTILKLIKTVDVLHQVSKITQGKIPYHPRPLNLHRVIKDQIEELERQYRPRQAPIIFKHHSKLPLIRLDPYQATVVFQNLLSNAVKYTPADGQITVSIIRHRKTIQVDISDTGIGIPQPEQAHLFSKFYRTTKAQEYQSEGIGLGLFIVKSYITNWGGQVTVESPTLPSGAGTTIHLFLPI